MRQSPVDTKAKGDTMDFSLSEEDPDTMDGLDIKPPQAHAGQASRKRREGHDRHHKRSERHGREERHSHRKHHRDRKEREQQHYQREKERYYKEQQQQQVAASYKDNSYSEVQYVNDRVYRERKEESSRRHAERKYEEKKMKEARYSEKMRREKYEEDKRLTGDRTLQDLRERLLNKRNSGSSKGEEDYVREKQEHRDKKYSENPDSVLQGESGMYVKEIISISTNEDRKHRRSGGAGGGGGDDTRYNSRMDDDKLTEEERAEQDLRREKLLEAEREMARQKEQRERRHLEKQVRKRRIMEDMMNHKRLKSDDNVVEVSDNSEDEEVEEEAESDYVEDEEDDGVEEDGEHRERSEAESSAREVDEEEDESRSASSERSPVSVRSDNQKSTHSDGSVKSRTASPKSNGIGNDYVLEDEEEEEEEEDDERAAAEKVAKVDGCADDDGEEVRNAQEETEKKIDEDLPPYFPAIQGCRSVEEFQCLNKIEEGTYGVVYRARDKRTDDIVALKRLKMEKEKEGFPITSLREINTLLKGQHPNIVTVREIVVGSNMDKIFIVMDYVEHDLKSLMETMRNKKQTFTTCEVKCLLSQLLKAVSHLHDNWILHRDLKTSNLLLSHKGILKVGDFGLAREYGSPLKAYTPIVVTLWYRAPELLLCTKEYSTPIDVWSVGCIFAELLLMHALFPGKSEVDQLNRIFRDLGTPNEKIWTGFNKLPAVQKMKFAEYPVSNLRQRFGMLGEIGLSLLMGFLTYDPEKRIAAEEALNHAYFKEAPLPLDPAMFPTWPAKSELGHRKAMAAASPKPPSGGREFKQLGGDGDDDGYGFRIGISAVDSRRLAMGGGFSLKF